jgi:hypothetical protein
MSLAILNEYQPVKEWCFSRLSKFPHPFQPLSLTKSLRATNKDNNLYTMSVWGSHISPDYTRLCQIDSLFADWFVLTPLIWIICPAGGTEQTGSNMTRYMPSRAWADPTISPRLRPFIFISKLQMKWKVLLLRGAGLSLVSRDIKTSVQDYVNKYRKIAV